MKKLIEVRILLINFNYFLKFTKIMELSLCILFENRAVGELKNFFSQFKKACPK